MVLEPFTFNACRFGLGSISLIPLLLYFNRRSGNKIPDTATKKLVVFSGVIAGTIIFLAAWLQQAGLSDTSAGKAAFLTGLYIVIVPIFGIFLNHKIKVSTWIAVAFAITGLYLLSVTESFTIAKGDLYEIAGAVLWAVHILVIDYFTKKVDALKLSFVQFLTSAVLSLIVALLFESNTLSQLQQGIIPILYGGIGSVGIAYTLQVFAQKHAKPSHAAIILSTETVFASLGGIVILNEQLGTRGYIGCAMMLAGMLLSQAPSFAKNDTSKNISIE
ncbi:hypothetical protein SRRS_15590 [Sporomusa rhizae]